MVFLSSLSAWWTYSRSGFFPWEAAPPLAAAALLGGLAGSSLAGRMKTETVKRVVGFFALLVGFFILFKAITC
jgi:uncharacterized membrane protein YfcA